MPGKTWKTCLACENGIFFVFSETKNTTSNHEKTKLLV